MKNNTEVTKSVIIYTARVCMGTGCISNGAIEVYNKLKGSIEKQQLSNVSVDFTGCHGFCQRGPIIDVEPGGVFYSKVRPGDIDEIVESHFINNVIVERLLYQHTVTNEPIPCYHDIPFYSEQLRIILRNCGNINPENIESYINNNGYKALEKALKMKPESIINEIKQSGLRGRGGAGFPTGLKWEFCMKAFGETKYLICNADEGDPGAFMDRSVLEADPHSVLEGMLIAAYSIGANHGYIYCRAEYPLALKRIRVALQQMEEHGFIGKNILGTNFNFDVKIKEGAGAFVCGEETALMASIEGKRGMPRPRPPFPAQSGLWGKPTNINNVKTLATIPMIIEKGAEWYSSIGHEKSKGTTVFALTGKIVNSGLVEVPLGIKLKELIFTIGGGIPRNKRFKAVQTGGPSGGCIPASMLESPVDYETLAAAGSIVGSGGMVVADEDTCMVDLAKYFLSFTQAESCGKCTPCRVGTRQMLDVLERITQGKGSLADINLLDRIANTVKDGSLCGLGQTAPNPVLSTLRYFRDEYLEHIVEAHCKAATCKGLVIAPCSHTCPTGINVPQYVAHIERGEYLQAVETIRERNPFPAVCGRICHHPCEKRCRRGELDEPIAIRALKRFAADWYFHHMAELPTPNPFAVTKKERVAIIGAGPAGLTCAYFLAQMGYGVTVFESSSFAGGMLSGALPDFRLPRAIVQNEVDYIVKRGVQIIYNSPIDDKFTLTELNKLGYTAVFIATGAAKSQPLGIPGEQENIKGFYYGLNFLQDIKKGKSIEIGSRVAIIGGGNVALDAARTALRLGASEVAIYYRRSREEMPVTEIEYNEAIEEQVKMNFLLSPTKIISNHDRITHINFVKIELGDLDSSGRRQPKPISGSDFSVEVDTIIAAVGQSPDLSFLQKEESIEKNKQGRFMVDSNSLSTNVPAIFAGGDFVTGPAMVIDAISAGRRAALAIDKYFSGDKTPVRLHYKKNEVTPFPGNLIQEVEDFEPQQKIPQISVNERKNNFNEIELIYPEEKANLEARRCLRCDLESS